MKITSDKTKVMHSVDVVQRLHELEEQYRTIYWTHIEDELYIYKPLGRKDFREIASNEDLSTEEKQDKVIEACILYPDDFDVDDYVAGVVVELFKKIMEVSYLDSEESRSGVMNYYRSEMFSLDNQVTCIINEAFPQFDIEEIENWDIERTSKYLSRAEWKLQNFRGMVFNDEYINQESVATEEQKEEAPKAAPTSSDKPSKEKMTPEKLRQLKAQFPEIDWENDAVAKGGIDAMGDSVDTMAPALRPGRF